MAAAASSALFPKRIRHVPAQAGRFWPLTLGAVGVVYGDYLQRSDADLRLYGDARRGEGIAALPQARLNVDPAATSFFLSRRTLRPASRSRMRRWQERLFIWLAGSAEDATTYFQIPPDRVVEIGTQITI